MYLSFGRIRNKEEVMEPKKAVVVLKKPNVKKLKIRIKKPIEPILTHKKKRKPSKKLLELQAQGKTYYKFVQDIEMMNKWCQYVIGTGIRPNERFRQLVEFDIKMFEGRKAIAGLDFGKVEEWYKNEESVTSVESDFLP